MRTIGSHGIRVDYLITYTFLCCIMNPPEVEESSLSYQVSFANRSLNPYQYVPTDRHAIFSKFVRKSEFANDKAKVCHVPVNRITKMSSSGTVKH